jgi:endonuclease-3
MYYSTRMQQQTQIETILHILSEHYGLPIWQASDPAIDELVMTILSQNTTDRNSGAAYQRLRTRYHDWQEVAHADRHELEETIRIAGLAAAKAERIQHALQRAYQHAGSYSLDFLQQMPTADAIAWLTQQHGIGIKTAACVLMFAMGAPICAVDTHVGRVAYRLGWVASRDIAKAHHQLNALLVNPQHYACHVLLIQHGKHLCHARTPQCGSCPLLPYCPTGSTLHQ